MRSSMRWNSAALSSMREPTGARTCSVIWPASTDGKKLRPRNGTSSIDSATQTRKPIIAGPRGAIDSDSNRP